MSKRTSYNWPGYLYYIYTNDEICTCHHTSITGEAIQWHYPEVYKLNQPGNYPVHSIWMYFNEWAE